MAICWRLHGDGRTVATGEGWHPTSGCAGRRRSASGSSTCWRGSARRSWACADRLPGGDDAVLLRDGDPAVPGRDTGPGPELPRVLVRLHRPVTASTVGGNIAPALGGIPATGVVLALIGLNLVWAARDNYSAQPWTATLTLAAIVVVTALARGFLGRLSILVGVAVAAVTGRDLDPLIGRALLSDGLATTLAGAGGGSGTTTYAENIGRMAATRVYSSPAHLVAAVAAVVSRCRRRSGRWWQPSRSATRRREHRSLRAHRGGRGAHPGPVPRRLPRPVNLFPAAVALVVGAADHPVAVGRVSLNGIALGTVAAVVVSLVLRARRRPGEDLPAGSQPTPDGLPADA